MWSKEARLKITGKGNPNYKGSKNISNGYIRVSAPSHLQLQHLKPKHRYIGEHRLVVEQHLGRILTSAEHIHHIDGNKQNNLISNLKIVTKAEHNKEHHRVKDFLAKGGNPKVFVNKSKWHKFTI